MKNTIKVGERVRVRLAGTKNKGGPTVWIVTELWGGFQCMIREEGTDNAPQQFDTSLLINV